MQRFSVNLFYETLTIPVIPAPTAATTDFTICEGDAIPDFEVDETTTGGGQSTYQIDDGSSEDEINTTIVSWGNMFPINTADCDNGCSVVGFDVGFGKDNNPANGPSIAGTTATWIIYTDDDGNPTAGLSAPLATGTHTIVNSDFTANGMIDNISIANIDICSTIATNPFLFISLSYTDNIGTVDVTAIDQSSSNGQSWIVSAPNGTQADWAGGVNNPFGGNWIIRANLDCQAPCITNWFDAPTAGTMVGTGTTFNSNGATGEEATTVDTNTPGIYTFYAEADCEGCVSETRTPFTLSIESADPAFTCPTAMINICQDALIIDLNPLDNDNNAGATGMFSGSGTPFVIGNQNPGMGAQIDLTNAILGVTYTLEYTVTPTICPAVTTTTGCSFSTFKSCAASGGSFPSGN